MQDCDIDEKGSKFCDSADLDRLFIQINSKLIEKGQSSSRKRKKKSVTLSLDTAGQFGMAVSDGAKLSDGDRRNLCRHEWINCLVRIAIMKYVMPGRLRDASAAVEALLKKDVEPKLEAWIASDVDRFRREVCYTEQVDAVLVEHKASLQNILAFFSDTEEEGKKLERRTMSLVEWLAMCKALKLLDNHFTLRDATCIFVVSRMRVVDELAGAKSRLKRENLSIEDCYEAVIRLACMKALPSDKEVDEAGCCDGGDFLLKLRYEHAEDEWLEAYYARRGSELDVMKPMQPAHRCVSQLLLLMIRTIESAGSGAKEDLQISRRELTLYTKTWPGATTRV